MDIFRFIDSADIRRYLAEIQYRFSTEEKMFLIWYCKSATLNEKITAWQEIVGYVQGCPWDYAMDIRERVAAYIELQEKMLGQFQSAGSCVYQYKLIDSLTEETDSGSVYRSYEDCLAAAKIAARTAGCCKLEIRKEPLDAAEHSRRIGTCLFNQDGEIMQINCLPTDAEDMMTYLLFEEMWFAFPTPFHSGDIVCSRFSPDEPFVLTDMVTWDSERIMKELPPSEYDRQMLDCADYTIERLLWQGDSRIMGAFGYRAEGGLIRRQKAPICDYLDLEYYRGSLDQSHKILQPVSSYLKGNCGIEFLLNAYCLLRQSTLAEQAE